MGGLGHPVGRQTTRLAALQPRRFGDRRIEVHQPFELEAFCDEVDQDSGSVGIQCDSFLLLVVMPGASSFLLLVVVPFVTMESLGHWSRWSHLQDLILKRQVGMPLTIKPLPAGSRITGLGPVGQDQPDQAL